jgi:hypothetical protein
MGRKSESSKPKVVIDNITDNIMTVLGTILLTTPAIASDTMDIRKEMAYGFRD